MKIMTCRRKTKKERELVADIRKTHDIYCGKYFDCHQCPLHDEDDCLLAWLKILLDRINIEE